MAFITLTLPEDIDPKVARILRSMAAQMEGVLSREHNPDGTHGAITARSINVEPNPVLDQQDDVLSLYGTDELVIVAMTDTSHTTIYTEGKSTVRISQILVGGAHVSYFRPSSTESPANGEMFLLVNTSGGYITLTHTEDQFGMRLPQDADYLFAHNVSMQFRFDGAVAAWRPFMVGGTGEIGDIVLRLGACPPGTTELTSFQDRFLLGGTVAAAGTTGGTDTHLHSLTITSGAGGGFTPAGSLSTDGAHTHTYSAATSSDGAHTHTAAGTTDSNGAHTHGVSGTTSAVSGHTHTYTGTTDPGGLTAVTMFEASEAEGMQWWAWNSDVGTNDHDHDYGGTTASNGGHDHTFAATTSSDGAHTHGYSTTTSSNGAHTHTAAGTTDSSGSHTHTFTGTPVGTHTHVVSGNTDGQTFLPPWKKIVVCQRN